MCEHARQRNLINTCAANDTVILEYDVRCRCSLRIFGKIERPDDVVDLSYRSRRCIQFMN